MRQKPLQVVWLPGNPSEAESVDSLTAVYMDSWTLEMLPNDVEMLFQRHHTQLWLPWFTMSQLLLMFSSGVIIVKVARDSLTGAAAVGGEMLVLYLLLPLSSIGAGIAALLAAWPGYSKLSYRMALFVEVVAAVVGANLQVVSPGLTTTITPSWCGGLPSQNLLGRWWKLGGLEEVLKGLTAIRGESGRWRLCKWMVPTVMGHLAWTIWGCCRKWYLIKEAWLLLASRTLTWLLSAPHAASPGSQLDGLVKLGLYLLLIAVYHRFEHRTRRSFLQELGQGKPRVRYLRQVLQPCSEAKSKLSLVTAGAAADLVRRRERALRALVKRRGSTADVPEAQQVLHLKLMGLGPVEVPAALASALERALAAQGRVLLQSYTMNGSLRLAILFCPYQLPFGGPRTGLSVQQLASELTQDDPQLRDLLLKEAVVQHGETLYYLRDGVCVDERPTLSPVVVDVSPRVLPVGVQVELCVRVLVRKPQLPASLSLVLRHGSTSLVLDVPYPAWQVQGTEMVIANMVMLPPSSGSEPLYVHLLEVFDGEVFSQPTPLLACDESRLFRELKGLEAFLALGLDGMMTMMDLLWSLKYYTDFCNTLVAPQRLHGPSTSTSQQQQRQCKAELEQQAGHLALIVQRALPPVLHTSCLLGLPALVSLLLLHAPSAFMLAEAPPLQSSSGAAGIVVPASPAAGAPPPAHPSAEFCALSHLLQLAGESGAWSATLLHLLVVSESAAAVKSLQDGAWQWRSELDWTAPAPTVSPAAGSDGQARVAVSAMSLAVLKLPKSGRVLRQALAGGRRVAEVLLAALNEVQPGAACSEAADEEAEGEDVAAAVQHWVRALSLQAQRELRRPGRRDGAPGWSDGSRARLPSLPAAAHAVWHWLHREAPVLAFLLAAAVLDNWLAPDAPRRARWLQLLLLVQLLAMRAAVLHYAQSSRYCNILTQLHASCLAVLLQVDAHCRIMASSAGGAAASALQYHVLLPSLAPLPIVDQVAVTAVGVGVRGGACVLRPEAETIVSQWRLHAAVATVALAWLAVLRLLGGGTTWAAA